MAEAMPATAQMVQGRLVSAEGNEPIAGAIVHLIRGSDGAVDSSALTRRDGAFSIRASATGEYRLRAELIGYETVETEEFALDSGAVARRDIQLPIRPVALQAIVVPERARCVLRPREGERLALVWEEARKALTAADLTARNSQFRYVVEMHERRLDARTGLVLAESRTSRTTNAARPFRSLPPESFRDRGWVQEHDGILNYFAPDARALLSDEFLDTHCLRLERTAGDSLLGVGFQPVRGRSMPDIAGTFWLDRRTSELRSLDFRYVNLRQTEESPDVGGVVEFQRLPEGSWIVRRWRIRMPLVARASAREWRGRMLPRSVELIELKEDGGRVVEVRDRAGSSIVAAAGATVAGTVYDSTRMAPLAGARVSVIGTPHATTTDESGRFVLAALPEGDYRVTFNHPRADSLVLSRPTTARVVPVLTDTVTVRLSLPPEQRRLEALCADELADPEPPAGAIAGEATGTLVGRVREIGTARPVQGALVHLAWSRWEVETDTYQPLTTLVREHPWRRVYETDAEGSFVSCRLPARVKILAWTETGGAAGEPARIYVPEGRFIQHDFVVPSSP